MLANRLYLGDAVHTGIAKHGAHYPRPEPPPPGQAQRAATPALLKGLIFGPDGKAMPLSHTRRRGRLYRFYRTATSLKLCHGECPIRVMPAGEIEAAVMNQLRGLLRAPEVVARVWRAAQLDSEAIDEREVVEAPQRLQPLWDQLFRVEQARIVQILVERGRGAAARRGRWSKRYFALALAEAADDGVFTGVAELAAPIDPRRSSCLTSRGPTAFQSAWGWQKLLDGGVYPSVTEIA